MSMPAEYVSGGQDLRQLLAGIAAAPAMPLHGLSGDSRSLAPGDAFVATAGINSHGLDYLQQAVDAGVVAVLWDPQTGQPHFTPAGVAMLPVAQLDRHVGTIADRWFDSPSRSLKVSGVTGTNGKTTVAYLITLCLRMLARKSAYIGTLGAGIDELDTSAGMTTPACIELHRQLANFRDAGAQHVALEVSSHALEQGRVDGVQFDSTIFTNLSRDHIDYHGNMRAYADAKAKLFLDFDTQHRIISLDSEFGAELAKRCGDDVVTVSTTLDKAANGRPYVFVRSLAAHADGSVVAIESSWGDAEFMLPLVGDFNVANAIEVLALLLCWDIPLNQACDLLEGVNAPPGRMQHVDIDSDDNLPSVYVDYAHTPDALAGALRTLRPHCRGRLWCVFGCGGDRDRGKRPLMGKMVESFADSAIVTNDNPRFETPGEIIAEVLAGMGDEAVAIEDRGAAIAWAVSRAEPRDVILVAGKGHETTQQIGDDLLPFSDYETALANLASRAAGAAR